VSRTFVVLDLETTGLDPQADEIVEVGLVRVEDGKPGAVFHALVRPSRPLPARIKSLTGLDDADLAERPDWSEVRPAVTAFLGNEPVVGHHVHFDLAFLERHAGYRATQAYDTVDLARLVLPGLPSYRLELLCAHLDLPERPGHRAMEDARAAAGLFTALLERFCRLEFTTQATVHRILSQTPGSPWFPLVDAAVRLGIKTLPDHGIQAAGDGDWPAAVPAVGAGVKTVPGFGPQAVEAFLGPGGVLTRHFADFEYRRPQMQVALAVGRALEEQTVLTVEAGTGTGKSFAYLVPAALWALDGGRRVVVSTHTVNLQDQLMEKDLPLLGRALDAPLKTVLLKGRGHYLCLRRWGAAVNEQSFLPDEGFLYARIAVWLARTKTGDRAELSLRPEEKGFWDGVAAGDWGCAHAYCRFNSVCFLQRARRAAEQAHLVITNHSLLLSDLKMENRLLPAYDALVLDEAHHLEGVATEQLGTTVSRGALERWVEGLNRLTGRIGEFYPDNRDEFLRDGEALLAAVRRFFALLGARLRRRELPEEDFAAERLGPRALDACPETAGSYLELAGSLKAYVQRLSRAVERLTDSTVPAVQEELRVGLEQELAVGKRLASDLEFVYEAADPGYVFWLEGGGRQTAEGVLRAAPVHVGELLHDGFFRSGKPVILTSATLTVQSSFSFFDERVGLEHLPRDLRGSLIVGSPFAYAEQALLYVVTDLPDPGDGDGAYLDAVSDALGRIVGVTRGRTLALFTAHKALRTAYRRLKPVLEKQGLELLGHGLDGGRARLLQYFRNTPQAVLFGASSFWEGVDVPGDALSCLVIVKLPFEPPNRPVLQARREEVRRRGRSDFNDLCLPQAVLRLKQGFGRLIRTTADRGVVIILDNRLVRKRYGALFLESLPAAPMHGSLEAGLEATAAFLFDGTFAASKP